MGKHGLIEKTVSSQAVSNWLPINYRNPHGMQLGIVVEVSAGADLTYNVEFCNDDLQNGETAVAQIMPTMSGKTITANSTLVAPATAIRLNVTAYVSGSATLKTRYGM